MLTSNQPCNPCQVKRSDMQPPKLSQGLLPEEFGELVREREHFYVRVFYPNVRSNFKHSNVKSVFTVHENEKKRA